MVLVAYDGSRASQGAIRAAARLVSDAAIVLHVWTPLSNVPAVSYAFAPLTLDPGQFEESEQRLQRQAEAVVAEGVTLAEQAGLRAEARLATGEGAADVWQAIVSVADDRDVDAIVVGHRGHSAIASLLMGSVSRGVVAHSRRPVLVVPAADADPQP
jgi:nucleotide-binding universal stress UspA family protein